MPVGRKSLLRSLIKRKKQWHRAFHTVPLFLLGSAEIPQSHLFDCAADAAASSFYIIPDFLQHL